VIDFGPTGGPCGPPTVTERSLEDAPQPPGYYILNHFD